MKPIALAVLAVAPFLVASVVEAASGGYTSTIAAPTIYQTNFEAKSSNWRVPSTGSSSQFSGNLAKGAFFFIAKVASSQTVVLNPPAYPYGQSYINVSYNY